MGCVAKVDFALFPLRKCLDLRIVFFEPLLNANAEARRRGSHLSGNASIDVLPGANQIRLGWNGQWSGHGLMQAAAEISNQFSKSTTWRVPSAHVGARSESDFHPSASRRLS